MLSVKPDFSFFSICGGNLAALNFQEVKSWVQTSISHPSKSPWPAWWGLKRGGGGGCGVGRWPLHCSHPPFHPHSLLTTSPLALLGGQRQERQGVTEVLVTRARIKRPWSPHGWGLKCWLSQGEGNFYGFVRTPLHWSFTASHLYSALTSSRSLHAGPHLGSLHPGGRPPLVRVWP